MPVTRASLPLGQLGHDPDVDGRGATRRHSTQTPRRDNGQQCNCNPFRAPSPARLSPEQHKYGMTRHGTHSTARHGTAPGSGGGTAWAGVFAADSAMTDGASSARGGRPELISVPRGAAARYAAAVYCSRPQTPSHKHTAAAGRAHGTVHSAHGTR